MPLSPVVSRLVPFLALAAAAVAQCSLTTTFAANNGQAGNMFDVVAARAVTVVGFDIHLEPGVWDVEVFAVTGGGSWQGNETTPAAWHVVAAATGLSSHGPGVGTPLPALLPTVVAANGTQGFYVATSNGRGLRYTNGTGVGNVAASDDNIELLEGSGVTYPFGSQFTPRVANVTVRYTGVSCAFTTQYGAGCGASVVPALSAGSPPALGTTMTAITADIPRSAIYGVTIFGLDEIAQPILGAPAPCRRLCSRIAVGWMDRNGTATLPVPADPIWIGTRLCGQSFLLDPSVNAPAPILVSNGLRIVVGT